MATSPLQQIASAAVDAAGLSISTATPSSSNAQLGTAYDLATMAAAAPIHFHPLSSQSLGGNSYLMINGVSWSAATASSTVTGAYTAFTANTTPTWVTVNAATGATSAVNGSTVIPAPDGATLTAAASRGSENLWLLHSTGDPTATLQRWFNNQQVGNIQQVDQETLPIATNGDDTIAFTAGVHHSATTTPYLYVYGAGSTSNNLYQARKAWATSGLSSTSGTGWEVYTGTGWSADMSTAGPISGTAGPLTSTGPVSLGHQSINRVAKAMTAGQSGVTYLATTQGTTTMTSQIYSSLAGRAWKPVGSPVSLGTAGSTYTGGTVQFQSHIGPNASMVDSTTSSSAIPYVVTTKASTGGHSTLNTNWSLLQVPRIS